MRNLQPSRPEAASERTHFTSEFRKEGLGNYRLLLSERSSSLERQSVGDHQGAICQCIPAFRISIELQSLGQGHQVGRGTCSLHLPARIAHSALLLLRHQIFSLPRKRFSGIYDSIISPKRSINGISFNIVKLQKYRHMCMPKRNVRKQRGGNIWAPIW